MVTRWSHDKVNFFNMSRNVVSGGSYCENLPDGSWAAIAGDGIQTHFGFVRSFNGALPLYLRITNAGGFKMAGQGSNIAGTLLWDQGWQLDPRICNGQSACIFDLQGHLHIVEPGEGVTSQGFRYVAANGTLVMGDATYGPRHGLNEYTDLSDAQDGSLLIGQGNPGGGVRVWDGATLRELEAGNCTFIRANRDGQAVAIAFVKAGEGSVFHWLTVAELRALPIVQPDAPPIDPPPVDPPDNPEPKPVPIPDQTAVIAAVRAKYPTPLGAQHGAFLLEAAAAVGQGAGLLRKDTGSNIQLPDGVRVSQDVMVFPNGDGYDFLGSGETSATPQWGGPIEGSPFPASRFYVVTGAQPGPGPTPGPTPTPTGSLDAMVKSMIAAAVAPLAAKVAALEAKPAPGPGGSFPSRIALKTAHGKYIAAETSGKIVGDRVEAGAWETFDVEAK